MADDTTSSLSEDFVKQITLGSDQGLPMDKVLKHLGQEEINAYVLSEYGRLCNLYNELVNQYKTVIDHAKHNNKELTDRIEHILSLMSTNMAFIKQLVQITDVTTTRLNEQEKINSKQELGLANLVVKQNQFAQCIANANKNSVAICKALEGLRTKVNEHDKFNSKIAILLSIGTVVVGWLMYGNNFSQILVLINKIVNGGS